MVVGHGNIFNGTLSQDSPFRNSTNSAPFKESRPIQWLEIDDYAMTNF